MSNEKKNATLGMSHGTASHRLRKILLFESLKRHGENVCVRCNQSILQVEDLSIEHIKPWEGISAELFWDLENIAFSHLRCNVPHTYSKLGGLSQRKVGPDGTAWCCGHKMFELIAKFTKSAQHWNGLHPYCVESRKEYRNSGL